MRYQDPDWVLAFTLERRRHRRPARLQPDGQSLLICRSGETLYRRYSLCGTAGNNLGAAVAERLSVQPF